MKQIFVSSTFKDMHIERDLIQTKLSPDLNESAYYKRIEGIKFQDLRWGIDTDFEDETDKDKKVLEVCLDEIENNRPYFCVLLGSRYGWIPENDLVKETGVRYGIYEEDEIVEKSITHLEVDYGFLRKPEFRDHAFAYIRNIKGDVSGTIYESDPAEAAKIEALKAEIKAVLPPENIHEYTVEYKDGRLVGVEQFVDFARKDMERVLLDTQTSEDDLTENEKEVLYHKTQRDEKSIISNARKNIEEAVIKNIEKENIVTIKGESGNGKSTLMAKISERIDNDNKSIILFSSLTPRTTSSTGIMRIITEYINESLKKDRLSFTDSELDEAIEEFNSKQETLASPAKKNTNRTKEEKLYEQALRDYFIRGTEDIIILIDAIDQLDNPRGVEDLLKPINFTNKSKIKFIISYLVEDDTTEDFIFLNDYLNYELGELSVGDRLEVINSSLKANNKELPAEIKTEIISKEGSKSPLYVALLVQRLLMMNNEDYQNIIRAGDGYEKITKYQTNLIKQMPNDLKELIIELITQAAVNLNTNTKEIYQTINYLGVSRRGLRESDLRLIYELKGIDYNSLDFATLKKYLRAFFLEDKYLRTDFTHKIIRAAILETIDEDQNIDLHNDIANAFSKLPVEDPIKLQEQYYSAYKGENKDSALELLYAMGTNSGKINNEDIQSAVDSITKIHNVKLDESDAGWVDELFRGFSSFDIEVQKVLLAYFVYGAYEEKTSESIAATNYHQEALLGYLSFLNKEYPTDMVIMRYYADQLGYLGVKFSQGSRIEQAKADEYLHDALSLNEKLYGLDPTTGNMEALGNSYSNIARHYLDKGGEARNDAQIYYQKSLAIFENIAEDEPNMINQENLAMAYNNIANLYASGEDADIECAKEYYSKTIDIIEELLEDHESISLKKTLAMGYINIASTHFSEDDFKNAEKWYLKAIEIIKEIEVIEPSLKNKETLAKTYNNTADLFASELVDDKLKAEEYYFTAVRIFESILRHKPIVSAKKSLSVTYDNIGNLYADWKINDAYKYYKKAIDIKEELLKISTSREDYSDLATAYNNLAFLYSDNRTELERAGRYYKRAVDLLHEITPEDIDKKYGEDLATVYTNLGALYFMTADLEESDYYYKKAIGIHKTLIEEFQNDDNIEKLLIIYDNLAVNKLDMDYTLEELEDDYIKVIELIKIIKDPYKKVKKTAITYANLGNVYLVKARDFKLAEDCYLKSVELTQWVIDFHESVENIERLVVIYYNLLNLYIAWGREDMAAIYRQKVTKVAEEIDFANNQENINKFIHIHDLEKLL